MNNELQNLLKAIDQSDYNDSPYEHFYATNVFSENFYNKILDNLPPDEGYHPFCYPRGEKHLLGTRLRCSIGRDYHKFHDVWEEVVDIFTSDELKESLFSKFKKTVRDEACDPFPILFRDKQNYKILPHPDASIKIITFQMYLPHDNSHEDVGTIVNTRKKGGFKKCKQFKFHRNSCYSFPVGVNSWHSVDPVGYENFDRNSLMVLYYVSQKGIDGYAV